jgi:hypothetical protein
MKVAALWLRRYKKASLTLRCDRLTVDVFHEGLLDIKTITKAGRTLTMHDGPREALSFSTRLSIIDDVRPFVVFQPLQGCCF